MVCIARDASNLESKRTFTCTTAHSDHTREHVTSCFFGPQKMTVIHALVLQARSCKVNSWFLSLYKSKIPCRLAAISFANRTDKISESASKQLGSQKKLLN